MGARTNITTTFARSLGFAPSGRQVQIRDSRLRGFYINQGSTTRTYMCQADCKDALGKKKTIRKKIGDVELVDADDARNEARLIIARIKSGEFTRTDEPKPVTLREAWKHFKRSKKSRLSPQTMRSYTKSIETVLADWLDLPLRNLSETVEARKLVRDRHAQETVQRGPFMANRSFQVLRTVYNHARKGLDDNLRDMPPTALVNFNEEPRYVVDDPDVVPKFWSALDKIENPVKRSFFAVLLLAGARPGDIKGLRWRDVGLERRTAYIANPKGGRAFELVLSTPMIEFIEKARFDDELVFIGMSSPNSYRESSMPLPAGKWRNVYQGGGEIAARRRHAPEAIGEPQAHGRNPRLRRAALNPTADTDSGAGADQRSSYSSSSDFFFASALLKRSQSVTSISYS